VRAILVAAIGRAVLLPEKQPDISTVGFYIAVEVGPSLSYRVTTSNAWTANETSLCSLHHKKQPHSNEIVKMYL
jgi:hypothetical protein